MNKRKARATARAVAQKQILRWHGEFMRYRRPMEGRIQTRDGVMFYQVGQNASHDFFVGVDAEGRKFRMTSGDESWDADGNPTVVEHMYAVEEFNGYFGHY